VGQDVQCTVTAALTDFTIAVSPAHAGQAAAITASPAGGVSLRWKFYARPQGGTTWTLVHDYQPGASAPWTPPTSGAWEVMVYAKEAASAKYYDLSRTTVVGVE
jgi:hypothetical protein